MRPAHPSPAWTPLDRRRYIAATMTWVDGVVLAVIAVSAVLAFMRGLVQEVLGVAAWIGAALAALALRPQVAPLLVGTVDPPWLADALATAGVFVVILIVLKLLVGAIARRVQDSALGGTDRALGLVFGVARGAFLAILAYILAGMVLPATERWPEPVRDARALPLAEQGARWLTERLPPEFRPRVAPLPDRGAPSFEQMLQPPARNRT